MIENCIPGAVLFFKKHQYSRCNEILRHLLPFREQIPEVEIREINAIFSAQSYVQVHLVGELKSGEKRLAEDLRKVSF